MPKIPRYNSQYNLTTLSPAVMHSYHPATNVSNALMDLGSTMYGIAKQFKDARETEEFLRAELTADKVFNDEYNQLLNEPYHKIEERFPLIQTKAKKAALDKIKLNTAKRAFAIKFEQKSLQWGNKFRDLERKKLIQSLKATDQQVMDNIFNQYPTAQDREALKSAYIKHNIAMVRAGVITPEQAQKRLDEAPEKFASADFYHDLSVDPGLAYERIKNNEYGIKSYKLKHQLEKEAEIERNRQEKLLKQQQEKTYRATNAEFLIKLADNQLSISDIKTALNEGRLDPKWGKYFINQIGKQHPKKTDIKTYAELYDKLYKVRDYEEFREELMKNASKLRESDFKGLLKKSYDMEMKPVSNTTAIRTAQQAISAWGKANQIDLLAENTSYLKLDFQHRIEQMENPTRDEIYKTAYDVIEDYKKSAGIEVSDDKYITLLTGKDEKKEEKQEEAEPQLYFVDTSHIKEKEDTPIFPHQYIKFTLDKLAKTIFKKTPIERAAHAQNIYALSKITGMKLNDVEDNYEKLTETLKLKDNPSNKELIGKLMILPVAAGMADVFLAEAPLVAAGRLAAGLGAFAFISEVENAVVSVINKNKYQFLGNKGLADLLPEESNDALKTLVEVADIAAKGAIASKLYNIAPELYYKFTKNIVEEYNLPRNVYIKPEVIRDIFQTGTKATEEELTFFKELGLKGKALRTALEKGINVEVPTHRILRISDKPFWAKLKESIGIKPTSEVVVDYAGKIKQMPAGLIERGEYTEGKPKTEQIGQGKPIKGQLKEEKIIEEKPIVKEETIEKKPTKELLVVKPTPSKPEQPKGEIPQPQETIKLKKKEIFIDRANKNINEIKRELGRLYKKTDIHRLTKDEFSKNYKFLTGKLIPDEAIKQKQVTPNDMVKDANYKFLYDKNGKYLTDGKFLVIDEKAAKKFRDKFWDNETKKLAKDYAKGGLKNPIEVAKEVNDEFRKKEDIEIPDYKQVLPSKEALSNYKKIYYTGTGYYVDKTTGVVIFTDGKEIYTIQKKYKDFFDKNIGDVEYYGLANNKPIIVKKKGELKGLIMPIEPSDKIKTEVKQLLAQSKPKKTPTKPQPAKPQPTKPETPIDKLKREAQEFYLKNKKYFTKTKPRHPYRNAPASIRKKFEEYKAKYEELKKQGKKEITIEDIHNISDINETKSQVGRKLPEDMRPVGNEFWVELLNIAKDYMTPYRYKKLRANTAGTFNKGGIKLKDIRNITTATHEFGHNIDWKMNNNSFPSSIKKRFPNSKAGERTLRAELKKVSSLMRPDLWTDGGNSYVKRHTELMADFISSYIIDPEWTRKYAPNMTKAFEERMPKGLIKELHDARGAEYKSKVDEEAIKKKLQISERDPELKIEEGLNYIDKVSRLGVMKLRNEKILAYRIERVAKRIDDLVPDKERQIDLVVIAENGSKNPYTGKARQEILPTLTDKEKRAIRLYRAYQELARQTVNKYLENAGYSTYIKFLEDYFIHFYETPLTKKYKSAIGKWYKTSPQTKKRVLPDLAKAVELGLEPRAKTLSDGLRLWGNINNRVAGNIAYLKLLPKIKNVDGESIIQNPKDKPDWPTRDYWAIRRTYARPVKGKILLFQGRVAIDPEVVKSIDAMFQNRFFNPALQAIEKINAVAKAMNLTLFSLFHHQTEFFSGVGGLGKHIIGFRKGAKELGGKNFISSLEAGKNLENYPAFVEDAIAAGVQPGRITTEGINEIDKMLKSAEEKAGTTLAKKLGITSIRKAYNFTQDLLWDNVTRLKFITYYKLVGELLDDPSVKLPADKVKEIVAKYVNDNYGGQEWMNMKFMRNARIRQVMSLLLTSPDWTISQIRMAVNLLKLGRGEEARLVRKISRRHWGKYLFAISLFTILGNLLLSGKFPWENERGNRTSIDYTNLWRKIDEAVSKLSKKPNWKERGDLARRYIILGKAGREIVRGAVEPLRAAGSKSSPVARELSKQLWGYELGSDFPALWKREDLDWWEKLTAREKSIIEAFKPFSLGGNNAFFAFPVRKGMTMFKTVKAAKDVYEHVAKKAMKDEKVDVTKVLLDIKDAAEQNGVEFKKASRYAMAKVRSTLYRGLYRAYINHNRKLYERYYKGLKALGAKDKNISNSLRRRLSWKERVGGLE